MTDKLTERRDDAFDTELVRSSTHAGIDPIGLEGQPEPKHVQ